MKVTRINEATLHRIIKEAVNNILNSNKYQVSFTFYVAIENASIKDKLLRLLDRMKEIVNCDVEEDEEDWCINCIAEITAESIKEVMPKMNQLLGNINLTWDYHYIKGLNTSEYWEP